MFQLKHSEIHRLKFFVDFREDVKDRLILHNGRVFDPELQTFLVLELNGIDATLEIATVPAFPMHESNAMRGIPSFDVRIRYLHKSETAENRDLLFSQPEFK